MRSVAHGSLCVYVPTRSGKLPTIASLAMHSARWMEREIMFTFKRIGAVFTVVVVVGLMVWFFGFGGGHDGDADHPEYQNQRY
jgi:hypothetical protein